MLGMGRISLQFVRIVRILLLCWSILITMRLKFDSTLLRATQYVRPTLAKISSPC